MRVRAGDVSGACGGRLVAGSPDAVVSGVSIDSRTVRPGDAFVALPGSRADGHAFVADAAARGAAAALVSRWPLPEALPPSFAVILVEDTLAGLTRWAATHRRRFRVPTVAVTGSVGKTTTKEMIAAVLGQRVRVLKSPGNYNNEIGIPLALLAWDEGHGAAVFELGMRGPGHIRHLAGLVCPDVGVVTNVGEVHLELLESVEAIADAKAELVEALPPSGAAVLNADDPRVRAMAGRARARVITFGTAGDADVRAEELAVDTAFGISFTLVWPRDRVRVSIPAPGRHLVHNALAAAAVALVVGLPARDVVEGLGAFRPGRRRLEVRQIAGVTVVDDTYNASPASLRAALDVAAALPRDGRLVVVLGDMLELGSASERAHREAGGWVAETADFFLAFGPRMASAVEEARRAGMSEATARHFAAVKDLVAELRAGLRPGDVVLVKGSRGMAMDRVVEALVGAQEPAPTEAGSS